MRVYPSAHSLARSATVLIALIVLDTEEAELAEIAGIAGMPVLPGLWCSTGSDIV